MKRLLLSATLLLPLATHAGEAAAGSGGALSKAQSFKSQPGVNYAVISLPAKVLWLNNHNQVLLERGFWESGKYVELQGGRPVDMNDSGVIVGAAALYPDLVPVVWTDPHDLPSALPDTSPYTEYNGYPSAYLYASPNAIDKKGVVYGQLYQFFGFDELNASISWPSTTSDFSVQEKTFYPDWYTSGTVDFEYAYISKSSGGGLITYKSKGSYTVSWTTFTVDGNQTGSREDCIQFSNYSHATGKAVYSADPNEGFSHPQWWPETSPATYFKPFSVNENGRYVGRTSNQTDGLYFKRHIIGHFQMTESSM